MDGCGVTGFTENAGPAAHVVTIAVFHGHGLFAIGANAASVYLSTTT